MTTPITNFNLVMVGENFPVQTVQVQDFQFRGRKLQEQLRIGPTLQAGTRGLNLLIVPDRFQVSVVEPDQIDIQAEGVREVAETFREYVGRRSVTHVGHNAQVIFPPGAYQVALEAFAKLDPMREILSLETDPDVLFIYQAKLEHGVTLKLQMGETGNDSLVLDFNFDYDLTSGETSLVDALDAQLASLRRVEEIYEVFQSRVINGRVLS